MTLFARRIIPSEFQRLSPRNAIKMRQWDRRITLPSVDHLPFPSLQERSREHARMRKEMARMKIMDGCPMGDVIEQVRQRFGYMTAENQEGIRMLNAHVHEVLYSAENMPEMKHLVRLLTPILSREKEFGKLWVYRKREADHEGKYWKYYLTAALNDALLALGDMLASMPTDELWKVKTVVKIHQTPLPPERRLAQGPGPITRRVYDKTSPGGRYEPGGWDYSSQYESVPNCRWDVAVELRPRFGVDYLMLAAGFPVNEKKLTDVLANSSSRRQAK